MGTIRFLIVSRPRPVARLATVKNRIVNRSEAGQT
jgi:hypothetical protein